MYRLAAVCFAFVLTMLIPSPANATSDFYTPPPTLTGAPGSIIKAEPMIMALSLPTPDGAFPGTATRMMYRSTNTHDQPNAVTGTYIASSLPWHGHGPRPLIALPAGTQGQGDQCAPSKLLNQLIHYRFPLDLMTEYEVLAIDTFLAQGYDVVMTDYEGLGTPGMHTYVNRKAQGYAVLDSVRAALHIAHGRLSADSPVVTWGYSQGGGASAAAGELQPSYAPDINLKGVYAGGPTANLRSILEQVDRTSLTGVIGYAMNSLRTQYPPIQKLIDKEANQAGLHFLDATAHMCAGEIVLRFGWAPTSAFTKTGETLTQLLNRYPAEAAYVDLQNLGTVAPQVPALIHHNVNDDILPYSQAAGLAHDWCSHGGHVWFTGAQWPPLLPTTGTGHVVGDLSGLVESQKFVAAWVNGQPTPSNCGATHSEH